MANEAHEDVEREFSTVIGEMTQSLGDVREVVRSLLKKSTRSTFDMNEGISLLSLKHHLLLSYLHSLTLLSAHRVFGHSLTTRTPPTQPFSAVDRGSRGSDAGDLVDTLVENRIVLDKVKQLESKMRYQIQKLVKIAQDDGARTEVDVINDPLAFRPNPQNLMNQEEDHSDLESDKAENDDRAGIYRPPRLAPMPYTEKKKDKSTTKRPPVPAGLAALDYLDTSNPHVESSTGLGGVSASVASTRARELHRMTAFEEENMTRLVMTKAEARRRARDEADVALGGSGLSKGRRRGGGLEDEFADVLRAIDRGAGPGGHGDGYEALRVKGRQQDALTRSKLRPHDEQEDMDSGRPKKKTRFQSAVKTIDKKRHR